ncbi:MAG: 4-(cytidine 5'-diphospho)-2-C-methyl-D-erythritol kinase [Chitinophagaceae bacterium]|nr:4-(cytidine 5'-diphospho)-2-C-methyl-D-erythritol kinase [Chitinophagaceae bacterium]
MVVFPDCKINIGLNITSKRSDGFHNIETIFYPIQWTNVLEITGKQNSGLPAMHVSGLEIQGDPAENICLKAYYLLKKDFPQLPSVDIYLHKTIPAGAGLGGGSADGAFTLKLLNTKFNLGLTGAQLLQYSLHLGSDCPFFIYNKPCFASGRGEEMLPITLDLSAYIIMLVNPGIHVNTGWAFSNIKSSQPAKSIKHIIQQPPETWKYEIINDFESPVFAKYPEIAGIKQKMYDLGAVYASMSGSGSTVYGIFASDIAAPKEWPKHYIQKLIR